MGPKEHVWAPAPMQSFMKTCMHYTSAWSVIAYVCAGMCRHMWTRECFLQVCAYASHVSDTLGGLLGYKLGTWWALGCLSTQEGHSHLCPLMKTSWGGALGLQSHLFGVEDPWPDFGGTLGLMGPTQ